MRRLFILAIFLTVSVGAPGHVPYTDSVEKIRTAILIICHLNGIDSRTMRALVHRESTTHHRINDKVLIGDAGEVGAGQLMEYHERPGKPLTNLYYNIETAVLLLKFYVKRYGDYRRSIEAYHRGPTGRLSGKTRLEAIKYRKEVEKIRSKLRYAKL